MNYKATRAEDGTLTIHRVPIFVECTRGDFVADAEWLSKAVAHARQSELEGYYAPLHVRHHDGESDVRAAGYFRVLGTEPITFKGRRRLAILADLVVTCPMVQEEVLSKRLPYRSVEIFNVEQPAIDSLALLDHEAPYLELPMLMVGAIEGEGALRGDNAPAFAYAKIPNPWAESRKLDEAPVVACFRRGNAAHLFFEGTDDMTKPTNDDAKPDGAATGVKPDDATDPKAVQMADGPDGGGDGEGDGEGGISVDAIVKAIADGSISVADMDKILEAIEAQRGGAAPEADDTPAPAAAPGGEAMSKREAELSGRVLALEARDKARSETERRKSDVAAAMKRLEGRPLGADLETKLETFHKAHGAEAFAAHVDSIAKTFATFSGGDRNADDFASQNRGAPEVAMKFQKDGAEAVERATRFAREHAELVSRGLTRMSVERYVEINMQRAAQSA